MLTIPILFELLWGCSDSRKIRPWKIPPGKLAHRKICPPENLPRKICPPLGLSNFSYQKLVVNQKIRPWKICPLTSEKDTREDNLRVLDFVNKNLLSGGSATCTPLLRRAMGHFVPLGHTHSCKIQIMSLLVTLQLENICIHKICNRLIDIW